MNNLQKIKTANLDNSPFSVFEKEMLSSIMSRSEMLTQIQRAVISMPQLQMYTMPTVQLDMMEGRFFEGGGLYGYEFGALNIAPPPPSNLPAVISASLRASGLSKIKWADLKTLPGAYHKGICTLGMSIFKHFDIKPSAGIRVVASVNGGDLLNSNLELNTLLGFLEEYAIKASPDNMTMSFDGTIDGYNPEVRLYHTDQFAYLAVFEKDGIEGRYVYSFERSNDPQDGLMARNNDLSLNTGIA
jgi:hypothetical protein